MPTTAYDLAQRFIGLKETPGAGSTPAVLAMLRLDGDWPESDATPWCSAFVNAIAWLLQLARSKSLAAKSWLQVGQPITLAEAVVGFDVVVLTREGGGHVGFFAGLDLENDHVFILGGNQHDAVTVAPFPIAMVVGVRRLG
jgi:uncharacterized protein (TIGR02594 family)